MIRRLFDRKRCRYSDCAERHPLASDDGRVSCPSCRAYLGLPPEGGDADGVGSSAVAH